MFNWWCEPDNFSQITHQLYASTLPFPVNYLVRSRKQSAIQAHLKGSQNKH
jgi:hypothetical protein